MSYLRHLEICNGFDPADFLPLLLADRRVGFIRRDRAAVLAGFPSAFEVESAVIRFAAALDTPSRRTEALGGVARALVQSGEIESIRGEPFAITAGWRGATLFELDRGAVPFFGTRSYGVHLNGYVAGGEAPTLWIGTRALDKKVAPGKLDNVVAGGISAGYDAFDTLIKESEEEADMAPALARQARPVSAVLYRMAVPEGMRDDVLFNYDLELPADFVPRNNDGELQGFERMTLAECLRRVREGDQFKFNVNLVLIDFALRHGAIAPDSEEYLAILTGLRGGLIREAGGGANRGG
jgi:hypothetical protein